MHSKNAPKIDITKIKGKVPILGICYGAQFLADYYGGRLENPPLEYGRAKLIIHDTNNLLYGLKITSSLDESCRYNK